MMTLFQLRRLIRQPGTWVSLLLLPVLILAIGILLPQRDSSTITVGIYVPADSVRGQAFLEQVQQYAPPQLVFTAAPSPAYLEAMVAGGLWECGYLLPDDLDDKISRGAYRRLITCFQSPATSFSALTNEAVAAALLDVCAPDLAKAYLAYAGILPEIAPGDAPNQAAVQIAADLQSHFFQATPTLTVEVVSLAGAPIDLAGNGGQLTLPALVRGLLALVLLLYSCLVALGFADDQQSGFYARLAPYAGPAQLFLPVLAAGLLPALLTGLASLALAGLLLPGFSLGFGTELVLLALYLGYLSCFACFFAALSIRRALLAATLPFLLMACLVFCPILVDIGHYLPQLRHFTALLPPTLYLRAVAIPAGRLGQLAGMAVGSGLWLLAGLGLWRRKRYQDKHPG